MATRKKVTAKDAQATTSAKSNKRSASATIAKPRKSGTEGASTTAGKKTASTRQGSVARQPSSQTASEQPANGSPKGVTKRFLKSRPACKVTFRIPAEEKARKGAVAGDFTRWDPVPMKKLKDGGFSLTFELETGASYQYRYLVDGERWCNDWQADEYVRNQFGWDNCQINL